MEILVPAIVLLIVVGLALLLIKELEPAWQAPLRLVIIGAALIYMLYFAVHHGLLS